MSFAIRGIGTAVPPTVVSRQEALGIARVLCPRTPEQESWLPAVYAGSGVHTRRQVLGEAIVRDVLDGTRHSGSVFLPTGETDDEGPTTGQRMAVYAEEAGPLALSAAAHALAQAASGPLEITHLVTISCTGFAAPGVDQALIRGLGLRPTVQRTHIGFMGCHGAINGLRVAQAFAGADPAARVLLCAVELCTLHYHYGWDPQRVVANALFADGAAAVIGGAGGAGEGWRVQATGSCVLPDSERDMGWTVGDHGFEMTLSKRVPGLIARHLRPWLEEWLGGFGLRAGDIRSWAVHPGGPRILQAVEEALELGAEALAASRAVLAEYGNMSSPTVLFILERLRQEDEPRPCLMLAFGPGLVAEAALVA
jgi:predicted naringenin-chalcone synthase